MTLPCNGRTPRVEKSLMREKDAKEDPERTATRREEGRALHIKGDPVIPMVIKHLVHVP